MTSPCLHRALCEAIRDHALASRTVMDGKAVCDRLAAAHALTVAPADLVLSEPDAGQRSLLVDNVDAVLRGAAAMPRCEQPREDLEVVSWQ